MEEKIVNKLMELVDKTKEYDDIPVACIITLNDKIIASDYNRKYKLNDPTAHAEILTIKKACNKLKRLNLSDCILYTTMFPCDMCLATINEVRIKKVKYILPKDKQINNTATYEQMCVKENTYFSNKIKDFFANKR